jgi:hypothetical protein
VFSYSIKPWALEMGGRYQKDHASFSVCALDAALCEVTLFSAMDAMLGALPMGALLASLEAAFLAIAEPMAVSKGLLADFGVLAEPNEAKAPEPRPNALEAALVGDAMLPPGVLKGLAFPCAEVSPPWRLERDALREESPADEPLGPLVDVVRDNLPEL